MLSKSPDDVLEFVDDEAAGAGAERSPGVIDSSCEILEVVWETILEKFGTNYRALRACWVEIIKPNKYIDADFKALVQKAYKSKKVENRSIFEQFIDFKIQNSKMDELVLILDKIRGKYLPKLAVPES